MSKAKRGTHVFSGNRRLRRAWELKQQQRRTQLTTPNYDLQKVNDERRRRGLPPLTRAEADQAHRVYIQQAPSGTDRFRSQRAYSDDHLNAFLMLLVAHHFLNLGHACSVHSRTGLVPASSGVGLEGKTPTALPNEDLGRAAAQEAERSSAPEQPAAEPAYSPPPDPAPSYDSSPSYDSGGGGGSFDSGSSGGAF